MSGNTMRSERTIRALAKELAGEFYDHKSRTKRFRSMDEPTRARALKQFEDGHVEEVIVIVPFREAYPDAKTYAKAHWPFFYDTARKCLTTMLALPDSRIHPNMKKAIYDALKEDWDKQITTVATVDLLQIRNVIHEPR